MQRIFLILLCSIVFGCNSKAQEPQTKEKFPLTKTEAEWKSQLTELEYHVMRNRGTESPFTSEFNYTKKTGVFACKACGTALFKSEHKYDSRSGWPSFDRAIEGNVAYSVDYDLGYARTEEHCANCGGHLGHVFDDGPIETTGKRHCVNGVSLIFIPKTIE
jgi:peptide-methionine (R)-S-oxide reductase